LSILVTSGTVLAIFFRAAAWVSCFRVAFLVGRASTVVSNLLHITWWLSLRTVHERSTSSKAAAWLTIGVTIVVRSIGAVVIASRALCMVVTHGKIIGTSRSLFYRAACWTSIAVAAIVGSVGADAAAGRRGRGERSCSRLDPKRIASFTLLRHSARHFSSSLVFGVHAIEALAILIAQCACLIKTVAGILLTIVFEANEHVARWTLITSSCLVYACS